MPDVARRALAILIVVLLVGVNGCASSEPDGLGAAVDAAVEPVLQRNDIPGMAVAVIVDGTPQYFYYGVASKETGQSVSERTLFEIGSVSKTFTATLAGYAAAQGRMALSDAASDHLAALRGGPFDDISMLNLGTYTAGGLPLQFPDYADDPATMIDYFENWRPDYPPGSQRLYSNPSLGLFGYLSAQSLAAPFDDLMQNTLFPMFGLAHTYVRVPADQMDVYAQGYAKDGQPARVQPGAMDSETYGVKTTAADLAQFLETAMAPDTAQDPLRQAISATHTGYYRVGEMTQGLGWESYAYPTPVETLLEGNSDTMAFEPASVQWLTPPAAPDPDSLFNKTGSTNGFGAYVAYVPAKRLGVVLLANKNYPIADRVRVAHHILSAADR